MRVIIYGRVNRLGLSADTQIEKLRSFCRNRAYEVIGEVRDCCSGSVVGDNLSKMLNGSGQDYDAIVIRDTSRISRNLVKMVDAIKKIRSKGVKLICTDALEMDLYGRSDSILKVS